MSRTITYQRAELHNHTVHSDGRMTVEELMEYGARRGFEVMALTDHNTTAGHDEALRTIRDKQLPLELIRGVEATTYYGHILALGTSQMIDLRGLDPKAPEKFLDRIRRNGAEAIGLAHPCCIGRPVMAGCRFAMELHNWNAIDYIEVFNTSAGADRQADLRSGNERALQLWEQKVLEGYSLAAVTGKDIHGEQPDEPYMVTYARISSDQGSAANRVLAAILRQETMVTRGPLCTAELADGQLHLEMDQSNPYLDWNKRWKEIRPVIWVKDNRNVVIQTPVDWSSGEVYLEMPKESRSAVIRLYDGDSSWENLLAAGLYVRKRKEEQA